MGKALQDRKEEVENSEYLPGSGEAHLQQGTSLRPLSGWVRAADLQALKFPLIPITIVSASLYTPVAVAWKPKPEAKFDLSRGTGSLAGHWSSGTEPGHSSSWGHPCWQHQLLT